MRSIREETRILKPEDEEGSQKKLVVWLTSNIAFTIQFPYVATAVVPASYILNQLEILVKKNALFSRFAADGFLTQCRLVVRETRVELAPEDNVFAFLDTPLAPENLIKNQFFVIPASAQAIVPLEVKERGRGVSAPENSFRSFSLRSSGYAIYVLVAGETPLRLVVSGQRTLTHLRTLIKKKWIDWVEEYGLKEDALPQHFSLGFQGQVLKEQRAVGMFEVKDCLLQDYGIERGSMVLIFFFPSVL